MGIFKVYRGRQRTLAHLDRADEVHRLRLPRLAQYVEMIGANGIAAPRRLNPVLLKVLVRPVAPLGRLQIDEVDPGPLQQVPVHRAIMM